METKVFDVESHRLEEQLFQYVMSCRAMSENFRVLSISTDKCAAAGMSLQNSCISFPNNMLAMCCPQAALSLAPGRIWLQFGVGRMTWGACGRGWAPGGLTQCLGGRYADPGLRVVDMEFGDVSRFSRSRSPWDIYIYRSALGTFGLEWPGGGSDGDGGGIHLRGWGEVGPRSRTQHVQPPLSATLKLALRAPAWALRAPLAPRPPPIHSQVQSGFDGEHLDIERPSHDKKRTLLDLTGGCESDLAKRQKCWLMRSSQDCAPKALRPPALQRTAAKRWLLALDAQLRCSTVHPGLQYFMYDLALPEWADWRRWPTLAVSMDLGSDRVAGYNALAHLYDGCVWQWPDPSHAAQRSFDQALRSTKLWDLWLLLMVSWNLEYGPWMEERRKAELQEATIYTRFSLAEVPLYTEMAPMIIAELEAGGVAVFARERPVEEECWEWMSQRARTPASRRRIALNRFGGSLHAAQRNLPFWHLQLFERLLLALEGG